MKVVIDTNVIVSAVLSLKGNPAEIMKLFDIGKIQLIYTVDIIAEYKRVLGYKKLNIAERTQLDLIGYLQSRGTLIIEPPTSIIPLSDESDRKFYDTAKASESILITGNLKHYPRELFVMNPADFLEQILDKS